MQAMQRVLEVPELLGSVFDQSDRLALSSASRVSRYWSQSATRRLWQNLDSLTPLLELLGPFEKKLSQWQLCEPITAAKWNRFQTAASNVKTLVFDAHPVEPRLAYSKDCSLSRTVFSEIAMFKPSGDILPNLRRLEWKTDRASDLDGLMLFLSGSLRELKISLHNSLAEEHILRMIETLSMRMPVLTSLLLRTPAPPQSTGPLIAQCIRNCPSLEEVHLPPFHMVPQIVEALGNLPSLRMLLVIWGYGEEYGGVGDHMQFCEGWWPRLEHLQFDSTLSRAIELMCNPFRPPEVDYLTVSIRHFDEDHQQLKTFFTVVDDAYPNLLMLTINLLHQGGAPSRPIDFDIFRPALELHGLLGFEISHNSPVTVEESHIAEMAFNWPSLRTLRMCADPVITAGMPEGLPLTLVEQFAKSFPFLNHLALFISTASIPPTVDHRLFSHLQNLHVGTSALTVKDVHALAAYFCKLLDTQCALVDGRSGWHPTHLVPATTEPTMAYELRETLWKDVVDVMECIRDVQKEDERRNRELEARNLELEIRVKMVEVLLGERKDVKLAVS